jgi:hypothetical protein
VQFWIKPSSNLVAVDDASISGIDCSSIPTNVEMVWWNGGQGAQSGSGQDGGDSQGSSPSGEILYNDRVAIRSWLTCSPPFPMLPPKNLAEDE